jgi:hypothetical protein
MVGKIGVNNFDKAFRVTFTRRVCVRRLARVRGQHPAHVCADARAHFLVHIYHTHTCACVRANNHTCAHAYVYT